jgi:type IV secretion system protein VirD4
LTFVNNDPDFIWRDATMLADMMMVPTVKDNPYWDNVAKDVVEGAIAAVCYRTPAEQRPIQALGDVLLRPSAYDAMIQRLRGAVDVPEMTGYADTLSAMVGQQRDTVLQVARGSLNAWSSARVAEATSGSDWGPDDLRGGSNPTVYVCIRPGEVDTYVSVLRVFIGQHIQMLMARDRAPYGSPPVLFMLDELPRLRKVRWVEEALWVDAKDRLRLWMFVQSVGQLKMAYENADGMIGSCAVRIYMNPSGDDGTAETVSEQLGYVESLNDNSRRRRVEAADLAGSAYRDRQIVIARGEPAIVQKHFAYDDPELNARMNA